MLRFVLYVEVAVNGMFGAGQGGMINPPDPDRHCSLSLSEIAVFDQEVYDLIMDLTILYDMTKVHGLHQSVPQTTTSNDFVYQ